MSLSKESSHNIELRQVISTVEQNLLDAMVQGPDSYPSLLNSAKSLQQKLAEGQKISSIDEETITLARAVVKNIMVMTQSLIDVHTAAESLQSKLLSEWNNMLNTCVPGRASDEFPRHDSSDATGLQPHRSSKPSLQTPRRPTATPISSALAPVLPSRISSTAASVTESTRSASDPNPLPEFIEHAYKFFVISIFNPYPTRGEKEAIVAQTNNERVTFSSISNWFTNARRRCGWTTILKERCDGNREQLVALATRVFVNPDPVNPVDPEITQELMEMKEAVETMYERKTRTSAWIEDLDNLEDLFNPSSGASTDRPRATEEDRRREQEAQKKEREFERQKRKMQAEALRKAEKVTNMMQRESSKQKTKEQRTPSFAMPYPPQGASSDEDPIMEPLPVAGGKRKLATEDDDAYRFPDLRQISPLSSRSSSFISDVSSEGRVPSLTWSDSGDERPYKRSRSSPATPPSSYTGSPRLSPSLEIPGSLDYSFNFEPQEGLTNDPAAFDTLFDFSIAPCETLVTRGKKRSHDDEEQNDATPQAKRRRASQPIIASVGPDLSLLPPSSPTTPPAPSTPLFTPRPSIDATPTQRLRKRSIQLPDLDTVLGLDLTQPPPVQIAPPDASMPLDVGVYDWSAEGFGDASAADAHVDFSQLLQFFGADAPQSGDASMDMLPVDLNPAMFLPQGQSHIAQHSALPEDLSGLISGLVSDEVMQEMGMDFSASLGATPNLSRESSVGPAMPHGLLPSATPADLAEKALKRERKRKELEVKRAELERERARLAELERELEDD